MMSLAGIPIELIKVIFNLFDESDLEMPLNIDKHRKTCKTLMALRLTCKRLEVVATPQLFRTFYISQSWRSWLNAHTFAANSDLRQYLQNLICDGHDEDLASYWQKRRDAEIFPRLGFFDFALFPNLKVFKLDNTWLLRKTARSRVKIPLGHCGIRLTSNGTIITSFDNIARCGFRLVSITHSLWLSTNSLDLSNLRSLRLYFYPTWWYQPRLEKDLHNLKYLPNLEEFHMDQYFPDRCDNNPNLHSMTNMLELFANGCDWPRLRYLDLRYLFAEVDHFKTFVALHAATGTLQTLEIHGELICEHVTPEEEQKRVNLPHWIKNVICAPDGGVETFTYFMGPPEEWHKEKLSPSRAQISTNMDMEDTDVDHLGAEDLGTNGVEMGDLNLGENPNS